MRRFTANPRLRWIDQARVTYQKAPRWMERVDLAAELLRPTGRLTMEVSMELNDDEDWPSDDEHTPKGAVGGFGGGVSTTFVTETFQGFCGGEVRLELTVHYAILPATPEFVLVNCEAKLFEGTSNHSTDLDGSRNYSMTLQRGQTNTLEGTIFNTDEGRDGDLGNDWGKFWLTARFE